MAVTHSASPPRPDLQAHREALTLQFPDLVKNLVGIIGKKLTAYIGSVADVRALDRWMSGTVPYKDTEARLRLAYHVAKMLRDHSVGSIVQAWLTGLNPELGDRAPVRLLREGDIEEDGPKILDAARSFIAGG